MLKGMQIRNLSPLTLRAYTGPVSRFARRFGRSPAQLGPEKIRSTPYISRTTGTSHSSIIITAAALWFLYTVTLPQLIPAPKQPLTIPIVLSPAEVVQFLVIAPSGPPAAPPGSASLKRCTSPFRPSTVSLWCSASSRPDTARASSAEQQTRCRLGGAVGADAGGGNESDRKGVRPGDCCRSAGCLREIRRSPSLPPHAAPDRPIATARDRSARAVRGPAARAARLPLRQRSTSLRSGSRRDRWTAVRACLPRRHRASGRRDWRRSS
jgi:hypothetical protein